MPPRRFSLSCKNAASSSQTLPGRLPFPASSRRLLQSTSGPLDSFAASGRLNPSIVDGMLDLMPSPPLIRHEWRRHRTCSSMLPTEYFGEVRVRPGKAAASPGGQRKFSASGGYQGERLNPEKERGSAERR